MPTLILNGGKQTGSGPSCRSGASQHSLLVSFFGQITTLNFQFEGRIGSGPWIALKDTDGKKEGVLTKGEIKAEGAYRFYQNQPVDYVRVNITELQGEGMVYANYKSEKN